MFRSPLFAWSPRPDRHTDPFDTPASQSSSRFGAFQNNIRSMINGSSIYSQSPAPPQHSTPKPPFLGFLRREHSPNPNAPADEHELSRHANGSRSPLRAHHTAGSYIQTIEPLQYPREPENTYGRHPADVPLPRHPADVPLGRQDSGFSDPEIQQLADDINNRRRKRKHRRRKHKRADHWVRRRSESSSTRGPMLFVRGTAARGKMIACIISGGFLLTVLATYLAIALTNRDLGQEIHILFIMVLLSITIFFCHSLIRLCMLILNPSRNTQQPQVQAMLGPDGFQPIVPIRVHLARDEENAAQVENDLERASIDLEKDVAPPPPAYGLWRSSVRVDPNLLHWQRVEGQDSRNSTAPHSRQGSASGPPARSTNAAAPEGPRPPSYASEDGVSYIVEAAPRSTVRQSHSGVSDIHPAWRPGYAISEIRGDEWGRRR